MHILIVLLIAYYVFNFLFLNYIYFGLKKYYKKIKYKEKETGKEILLQEKYGYAIPTDSLNYFSFVIIGLLLFPIRNFLLYFIFLLLKIHLKILKYIYKNHEKDENQRLKLEKAVYFWLTLYFIINNISTQKKQIKYEEIYKKYLGEDYDFSQKDFSIYISNHLGFLEFPAFAREYGVSFLLQDESKRHPLLGGALAEFGSIFVKLQSKESRKKALDTILKRQNDFYNKKNFIKTLNFPEGTTTNGKYIGNFKKGSFISLLPIKPLILFPNDDYPCYSHQFFSFLRTLTSFKVRIIYAELPIIKPTNYMYEKYKNLGKEKWEIYSNVVNKIYSEIGGFKQVSIDYRNNILYQKIVNDGFYVDK